MTGGLDSTAVECPEQGCARRGFKFRYPQSSVATSVAALSVRPTTGVALIERADHQSDNMAADTTRTRRMSR